MESYNPNMTFSDLPTFQKSFSNGGQLKATNEKWQLEIPAGKAGMYRLAQIDDYHHLSRNKFPHTPPVEITLDCRSSSNIHPGTWGFGLWNDPFSLSVGLGGGSRRFPALPNSAWFFFASEPNYLSLRDDLPAFGQHAAVFRSVNIHPALLATFSLLLPGLLIPSIGQTVRRLLREWIQQDAVSLDHDATVWTQYKIQWGPEFTRFYVNNQLTLETQINPIGPLGFVLWIDNQYAAFPPNGRLAYGTLPNSEPAWIDFHHLRIDTEYSNF